jgi:hypothetical protein
MTTMLICSVVAAMYAGFNLVVTRRLNRAFYMDDGRRLFHRKFIWLVPFVGPIIIIGFWRKTHAVKFDTMTKQQRDKKKGIFMKVVLASILETN